MRGILIAVSVLLVAPLSAQNGYSYSGGALVPGNITTPKIQLGSDIQPSVIQVGPVEVDESPGVASEAVVSNATPASTQLLSTRHFDYIVSPVQEIVRGSMEDASISLGDYARRLRAEKQTRPSPNAMAQPAESK
jgi:hypothetical protein